MPICILRLRSCVRARTTRSASRLRAGNFAANPPSERSDELVVASRKDDLGSCSKATTPAPAPLYGLTAQDDDGGRSTAVAKNLAGKGRKALQQESFRRRSRRP
jgi:hypothetical protein